MENTQKMPASAYYLSHKKEFTGESGHEKMVQLLIEHTKEEKDTLVLGIDVGANVGKYISNIRKICKEDNKKIIFSVSSCWCCIYWENFSRREREDSFGCNSNV